MSSRRILEKLLRSGQSMLEQQGRQASNRRPQAGSGRGMGNAASVNNAASGMDWKGLGTAALSSGLLGSLIGGRRRRGFMGRMGRLSTMAGLAGVAYQAYSQWQQQKQGAVTAKPLDQLPEEEVERHSNAMLKAIIAAAKADGHIDAHERAMIEQEIAKDPEGGDLRQWFDQELSKPLDPQDVARAAETPEMAAEMYTASVLIADERNAREQAYLDELALCMRIPPDLKARLEQQVRH